MTSIQVELPTSTDEDANARTDENLSNANKEATVVVEIDCKEQDVDDVGLVEGDDGTIDKIVTDHEPLLEDVQDENAQGAVLVDDAGLGSDSRPEPNDSDETLCRADEDSIAHDKDNTKWKERPMVSIEVEGTTDASDDSYRGDGAESFNGSISSDERWHQSTRPNHREDIQPTSTPNIAPSASSDSEESMSTETDTTADTYICTSTTTSVTTSIAASTTTGTTSTSTISSTSSITPTANISFSFVKTPSFLSDKNDGPELPHRFKKHTYQKPTQCDICSGLLVGLWNQGLKCECCGMNVHHGQGKGDHDDCRAEALLNCCKGCKVEDKSQPVLPAPISFRQAFQEVRDLAKTSPNFLMEVKEQFEKDVKSNAKKVVVKSGAQQTRLTKLRRLRERVVPLVELIDKVEKRGSIYSLSKLLYYHFLFAVAIATVLFFVLGVAMLPTPHNLSVNLILLQSTTVLGAFHLGVFVLALVARRASFAFQRKQMILDHFLRDFLTLDAEKDIGISVADAVSRSRTWSDKILVSSSIAGITAMYLWYQTLHLIPSTTNECPSNGILDVMTR